MPLPKDQVCNLGRYRLLLFFLTCVAERDSGHETRSGLIAGVWRMEKDCAACGPENSQDRGSLSDAGKVDAGS